jgi:uncharacterized protein with PIN domain
VDGRIEHGFRARLRAAAALAGCEVPKERAEALVREARATAGRLAGPFARALAAAWEREVVAAREKRASADAERSPRFLCDPSLGGLARWLRAAGYEAATAPDVAGHRLPDEALRRGLVLITTDAEVLDRRIVADGSLRVAWVPSALTTAEQLHMVALDLGLALREPRCMACGGVLVARAKDEVRPRIPPRTALWKDDYFVCAGCDRLFWRGTHWERIEATLRRAVAA